MKTPTFDIDSVERVLADNANKREALKSAYAARQERLKTKEAPRDQANEEA